MYPIVDMIESIEAYLDDVRTEDLDPDWDVVDRWQAELADLKERLARGETHTD